MELITALFLLVAVAASVTLLGLWHETRNANRDLRAELQQAKLRIAQLTDLLNQAADEEERPRARTLSKRFR